MASQKLDRTTKSTRQHGPEEATVAAWITQSPLLGSSGSRSRSSCCRSCCPATGSRYGPNSRSNAPESVSFTQHAVTVPTGFDATLIPNATGEVTAPVKAPTKMAIAPDGRIFIAEHWGNVRIVNNGAVVPTPFRDIARRQRRPHGLARSDGDRARSRLRQQRAHVPAVHAPISATVSRNRIVRIHASAGDANVAELDVNNAPIEMLLFEMTNQTRPRPTTRCPCCSPTASCGPPPARTTSAKTPRTPSTPAARSCA